MDLTVFRQASKARDGRVFYKGEDTRPYVSDNIILVADGLGGSSSIRHQSFNRDMFDEDKLFDALFNGVFEGVDEDLRQYVVESFREFLSISDCYFDNVNNIKKSGYFGSRIVSAVFLYLAKRFLRDISAEKTEEANEETAEQNLQDRIDSLGEYFTNQVKEMLLKVSQNANLIYESSFSGLSLLGTTLCATIAFDKADYVEALYFVAGDSRPYLWNKDGLQQVSADQERADGGMTNSIKANGDFKLVCEYRRFQKPCILFNASDGIFDSKLFHISQLALEKLLLETIRDSQTPEEVANKLETIFVTYGTHDDSSTMALKAYGYDSFDEIRSAAEDRLNQIETEFLSKMPDLIEHDYEAELNSFDSVRIAQTKAICNALWEIPKVVEHCKQKVVPSDKLKALEERLSADMAIQMQREQDFVQFCAERKILINLTKDKYQQMTQEEFEIHTQKFIKKILSGVITLIMNSQGDLKNKFDEKIDACKAAQSQVEADVQARDCLILEEAQKAWLEICSSEEDVLKYALDSQLISQDEYDKCVELYPPISEQKYCVEEKVKQQKELLDIYDKTYFNLIQGD